MASADPRATRRVHYRVPLGFIPMTDIVGFDTDMPADIACFVLPPGYSFGAGDRTRVFTSGREAGGRVRMRFRASYVRPGDTVGTTSRERSRWARLIRLGDAPSTGFAFIGCADATVECGVRWQLVELAPRELAADATGKRRASHLRLVNGGAR